MAQSMTFEGDATEKILDIFNKDVDEEGYIVDSDGDRVITPEGEKIHSDELAGIKKGSEIFVKDNFVSLINFVKSGE